ncbi:MAG: transcriptional regulator [Candidatus Poribacteria bacterium]|nr:transcriptional regulator [Candidatus Poribacteria bacterium]
MRKYRTWEEILMERFTSDWKEAIGYLDVALEEYQEDGDTPFFLMGLQNVVEAQGGVSAVAKKIGVVPQVLSDMLSSEKPPRIDLLSAVLTALGCRLSIQPLKPIEPNAELAAAETSIVTSEISASSSEVSVEKR